MSSPLLNPRFRAWDSNGVPLAGGLLSTFAAGTDTPITLYQDPAFATPHPVTITLDANGEALIFSKVPFKAALTDADGVVIDGWPIDNLEAPPYHSNILLGPTVPATPPANVVALYASGNSIYTKDSDGNIGTFITSGAIQQQSYTGSDAGGSANAITATFSPTITTLTDKLRVSVVSSAANTGAVTFAPDGLLAKPVISYGGSPLAADQIPGANYPLDMEYVLALDSWVLLNRGSFGSGPSAAKAWVMVTGASTPSIGAGFNVASITDSGTGTFVVVFTVAFSSQYYGISGICLYYAGVAAGVVGLNSEAPPAAADCGIKTWNSSYNTLADLQYWSVIFFGDQS